MDQDRVFRWRKVESQDEMTLFFVEVLPTIKSVARGHGYGIAVHGSMKRDLDLLAVPWTYYHSDKSTLAAAIHQAVCGIEMSVYQWEEKPHGRSATMFPICFPEWPDPKPGTGHIDLSVVKATHL